MEWLEEFVRQTHASLRDREREALAMRGVSDEQIDLYRIGVVDQVLPDLPYSKGFLEQIDNGKKLDDVFVLPLTNTLGQIRGLQFRHVDQERGGYSTYTPFPEEPTLFGLGEAMPHVWECESVWLVEGGFDLFPIQRVFPNIVATLTARVTVDFAKLLRRLVTKIYLGYDMDSVGRSKAQKVSRDYGQTFRIYDVSFPRPLNSQGKRVKDPAELWEVWGDRQFGVFLRNL